jgi:hypothetical protein
MYITQVLNFLKELKSLPAYQLERRLDAFILPLLEDTLNKVVGADDFKFIYAELPMIPHYNENNNRRRDYADYVLYSPKRKEIYLVELKSDNNSINEDQFLTYLLNCNKGWKNRMEDYVISTQSGRYKEKYIYGLDFLKQKGGTAEIITDENIIMKFIYIAPSGAKNDLEKIHRKYQQTKGIKNYNPKFISFSKLAESAPADLHILKEVLINIDTRANEESDIVSEIKGTLESVQENAKDYKSAPDWTIAVKTAIGKLGQQHGFEVCASGCNSENGKGFHEEWLYDLVWYNEEEIAGQKFLTDITLVMESEWKMHIEDIRFDFEKLLLANAPYKLMVCCVSEERLDVVKNYFQKAVNNYTQGSADDKYIIAILDYEQEIFQFEVLTKTPGN